MRPISEPGRLHIPRVVTLGEKIEDAIVIAIETAFVLAFFPFFIRQK